MAMTTVVILPRRGLTNQNVTFKLKMRSHIPQRLVEQQQQVTVPQLTLRNLVTRLFQHRVYDKSKEKPETRLALHTLSKKFEHEY